VHTTGTEHKFHGTNAIRFCGGDMVCKVSARDKDNSNVGAVVDVDLDVADNSASDSLSTSSNSPLIEMSSSKLKRESAQWARKLWAGHHDAARGKTILPIQATILPATQAPVISQSTPPDDTDPPLNSNSTFVSISTGVVEWQDESLGSQSTGLGSSSTSASKTANKEASGHEVLYCFASAKEGRPGISTAAKEAFMQAFAHIVEQVPCISFRAVEADPNSNDCVEYPSIVVQSEPGGCWSHVGQVSDTTTGTTNDYARQSQPLNLGPGCGAKGLVVHQLVHTLGILHEINRPDRDSVIHVDQTNLKADVFEDAFKTVHDFDMNVSPDAEDTDGGFDFLSVMMHGLYSFSKTDGGEVSKPHDIRAASFMGQRMGLSELDARLLGGLYGCPDSVSPSDSNALLSKALRTAAVAATAHGDTVQASGFAGECKDHTSTEFTDAAGVLFSTCYDSRMQCDHPAMGHIIRNSCPRTCHECVPLMWPAFPVTCVLQCEVPVSDAWVVGSET